MQMAVSSVNVFYAVKSSPWVPKDLMEPCGFNIPSLGQDGLVYGEDLCFPQFSSHRSCHRHPFPLEQHDSFDYLFDMGSLYIVSRLT